jgi:hypothetical protein
MKLRQVTAFLGACGLTLLTAPPCLALDSYRYLHVTIDTPWTIFLFLLVAVLSPFILMAVLVWRYTERRVDPEATKGMAEYPER